MAHDVVRVETLQEGADDGRRVVRRREVGETIVAEAVPTRDHTERALEAFGATVGRDRHRIAIEGGQPLYARDLVVPGDISSAVFWLTLGEGRPGPPRPPREEPDSPDSRYL